MYAILCCALVVDCPTIAMKLVCLCIASQGLSAAQTAWTTLNVAVGCFMTAACAHCMLRVAGRAHPQGTFFQEVREGVGVGFVFMLYQCIPCTTHHTTPQ